MARMGPAGRRDVGSPGRHGCSRASRGPLADTGGVGPRHRTSESLIPPGGRRWAVTMVVVSVVVGGVFAQRYEGTSQPGRIDVEVADVLRGWPVALRVVVSLGDPGPLVLLVLVVALWAAWLGRGALIAVVAPVCAVLTTAVVLKPLVGRTLGEGLAYPSTHMTGVGSVLVVIGVLVASHQRWPALARWAAYLALLTLGAVKAGTLSALGLHYATDTVGGVCVAVGVVLAVALVRDALLSPRRSARRSPEPATMPLSTEPR